MLDFEFKMDPKCKHIGVKSLAGLKRSSWG